MGEIKNQLPLAVERYFFAHQEVISNQNHNPDPGVEHTLQSSVDININFEENEQGIFLGECTVRTDDEQCINPRYSYKLTVIGFFRYDEAFPEIEKGRVKEVCKVLITQLLVGVIRERLNEMTSRGPWGEVVMGLAPLAGVLNNKSIDETKNL